MNVLDLIGFFGVFLILMAYFCQIAGFMKSNTLIYIVMNLVGSSIACAVSVIMDYFPFVLLEGVWAIVSFAALLKYMNSRKHL